ncbi:MAG: PilN domain-containing protein [Candidatus Electrothrix aestuarii]|uniref:PilN domain-containing protein n=1 Tax=Candidatus Electrothrix aestuarii TaxID=3062594 RepID=A0AAU8M0F7_9BACT|nr:PilN domain-containing protein [Candidatus Electrothrix aestuarii]WPD23979.1 MAG: PilN domain-containing protein [Candidatus Electrothrix sp. GW3-3]
MKQKTRAVQQLVVSGALIAATLVALSLGAGYFVTTVSGLEKDIKVLTARKKELQKTLDLIVDLEKKKKLIEKQIGVIHELQKKTQLTVRILDEVARLTPHKRLWLTSLNQTSSTLNLSGTALDNRTIADYLDALNDSQYFSNVTLRTSALSKYGGRNLKRFSLTCSVTISGANEEASQKKGGK